MFDRRAKDAAAGAGRATDPRGVRHDSPKESTMAKGGSGSNTGSKGGGGPKGGSQNGGNWPSTTGNPSGGGRGNGPPK
ncbi:MAG: hypothetical protein U0324_33255 [Polyangiales bacterium]